MYEFIESKTTLSLGDTQVIGPGPGALQPVKQDQTCNIEAGMYIGCEGCAEQAVDTSADTAIGHAVCRTQRIMRAAQGAVPPSFTAPFKAGRLRRYGIIQCRSHPVAYTRARTSIVPCCSRGLSYFAVSIRLARCYEISRVPVLLCPTLAHWRSQASHIRLSEIA